jgi:hypothetical protein
MALLGGVVVVVGAEPAEASVECVSAVADEADALEVAVACEQAVEVLDARTPWES